MVRDKKHKPGKEQLQVQEEEPDIEVIDEEIEAISEIDIPQRSFLSGSLTQVAETFASTQLGQMVLIRFDGLLRVIEDTAKWSLPQDDDRIKLRRPLPWPVTPQNMVQFLQNRRRQLRAIRVEGLRAIESRKNESPDGSARTSGKNTKRDTGFITKVIKLFTRAICTPRPKPDLPTRRLFAQDVKEVENVVAERPSKRPRDEGEEATHNLTVSEMLDKYANESSDNDSDYVPNKEEEEEEEEDDEGSSTSRFSSSSAEETAKENKSSESENDSTESQKAVETEDFKENGEKQYQAKLQPLAQDQYEIHNAAESDNEQVPAPKEMSEPKAPVEPEGQAKEVPKAAIEVATQKPAAITPKIAPIQLAIEWSSSKFTPGHESAALQKPSSSTTPITGSFQDFHSIFHPAPIVKPATEDEEDSAQPSTQAEHSESSTSKGSTPVSSGNPKKNTSQATQHKYYIHYNKGSKKSYR